MWWLPNIKVESVGTHGHCHYQWPPQHQHQHQFTRTRRLPLNHQVLAKRENEVYRIWIQEDCFKPLPNLSFTNKCIQLTIEVFDGKQPHHTYTYYNCNNDTLAWVIAFHSISTSVPPTTNYPTTNQPPVLFINIYTNKYFLFYNKTVFYFCKTILFQSS